MLLLQQPCIVTLTMIVSYSLDFDLSDTLAYWIPDFLPAGWELEMGKFFSKLKHGSPAIKSVKAFRCWVPWVHVGSSDGGGGLSHSLGHCIPNVRPVFIIDTRTFDLYTGGGPGHGQCRSHDVKNSRPVF